MLNTKARPEFQVQLVGLVIREAKLDYLKRKLHVKLEINVRSKLTVTERRHH